MFPGDFHTQPGLSVSFPESQGNELNVHFKYTCGLCAQVATRVSCWIINEIMSPLPRPCALPAENMSCDCNNKGRTNRAESNNISGGGKHLDSPTFIFFLFPSHHGDSCIAIHLYFGKPLEQIFFSVICSRRAMSQAHFFCNLKKENGFFHFQHQ